MPFLVKFKGLFRKKDKDDVSLLAHNQLRNH